jgi:AraC-like DNA-binding protein
MQVVFSTSSVHARDRISYWQDEASKAYVAHEFKTDAGSGFSGDIRAASVGGLELALFTCGARCLVDRTEGCIKGANDDALLLGMQIGGSMTLHQDGRDAVTGLRDVFLLDPRRPFALDVQAGIETLVVKVPRRVLQARLGVLSALTARPVSCTRPEVGLASGFLAMLAERAHALDEAAGAKVAQQALDLVALAFEVELPAGRTMLSSSRNTTLLRLKAIIESRLADSALKPKEAAAAAGISVRYANALLAQEGMSLERFIVQRRLQHCKHALEDQAQALRPVSDIAYACGFSDVSHFTRRFKQQFGCSPTEARARALAGQDDACLMRSGAQTCA